ncbi:amidohydrolase [Spongiibacter sp. UBA1325]|uniref:amidohydrolase n=1 Tax=Spongiibacter sp. UBA1325 TaxID=1947543 RepID=UPI00257FEF7B|nr:amidohydrolase [Spongiibacter sp. UBA1325]
MRLMIKSLSLLLVLLALLAAALWFSWRGPQPPLPSQQAFVNGHILTMDAENRIAEALLLNGERIEAVGNNAEIRALIDDDVTVYDLQGRTLLPGFIDAHGHFPGTGLSARGVDLSSPPIGNVNSIADIQSRLRAAESALKEGQWLFGFGYDDSLLTEARHPTRDELDAVSTQRPIYLMHSSGHLAVTNSAGLALAGIGPETPDPEGGEIQRDESGRATGLLLEHATDLVAPLAMDFTLLDFVAMADMATQQYLQAGVTTVQSGGVDGRMLQGLYGLSMLNRVPQRVIAWPMGQQVGEQMLTGDLNLQRFQSKKFATPAVKLVADGSIQGYTAYLAMPYHRHSDADFVGFARYAQQQLDDDVAAYHCRGYQLAIHGNGDAAIDMLLDAFERAQQQCPNADPRAIVVHAQTARPDQLDRMKSLGMTPSFFVAHTFFWGDRHREQFLGPARAAAISPLKNALDRELRFTTHLDSPVVPMDIGRLLWSAVTRETRSGKVLGDDQRVSIMQALRSVTIDAAWQSFQEEQLGSLEPGKLADMVLLDRDPLRGPEQLLNFKVDQLWIGGRCYYQRDQQQCLR